MSGDCFEVNAGYILDNFFFKFKNKKSKDVFLCHGKVIGAKGSKVEGEIFVHAWIEIGDVFMDYSNGNSIITGKEKVYATGRILVETVKKYSPKQVANFTLKQEHYGPWAKEFCENG